MLATVALLTALATSTTSADGVGDDLLRAVVGEVAAAQLQRADPAWQPAQRDCAGLVRFAYRSAYKRLRPQRLQTPLFVDKGVGVDFADAETLVTGGSFVLLGRDERARRQLQTGDVLAWRLDRGDDDVAWHLMMAVVLPGGEVRVVYHPGLPPRGQPDPGVRQGLLRELVREAPVGWRPDVDNPFFLGFFRFAEWTR